MWFSVVSLENCLNRIVSIKLTGWLVGMAPATRHLDFQAHSLNMQKAHPSPGSLVF